MISSRHGFIFLHVPKTGGNAIQTLLLPLSDDRMVTAGEQDGVNRFGIRGPVTPHKHATLQDYAHRLGDALQSYRVIITLRPPLERMVSLYFSPHRWKSRTPVLNREDFLAMARKATSTAAFLRIGGVLRQPDFTLRFETLSRDFARMVAALELPVPDLELPCRNPSAGTTEAVQEILADASLRKAVEDIFREDMVLTTGAQHGQRRQD